jgi:hypothetical protein
LQECLGNAGCGHVAAFSCVNHAGQYERLS